jgi:hypothetical protein
MLPATIQRETGGASERLERRHRNRNKRINAAMCAAAGIRSAAGPRLRQRSPADVTPEFKAGSPAGPPALASA